MTRANWLVAMALVGTGGGWTQPATATFEAAAIHEAAPRPDHITPGMAIGCRGGPGTSDPAAWNCRDARLGDMILQAYELEPYQFVAGQWMPKVSYDVFTKVRPGATRAELREMQRAFLAERFHLKVHHEQKLLPVYRLTMAKGGLKMKESDAGTGLEQAEPGTVPKFTIDKSMLPQFPAGHGGMLGMNGRFHWVASGISTAEMVKKLATSVNAIVRDETGLSGKYDIDIAWTSAGLSPGADGPDVEPLPTLEEALRRKLGLSLEQGKEMVDVVVVDFAEKAAAE